MTNTLSEAPAATAAPVMISDEQRRQYREQGYFVLENVIPPDPLEMLREVCALYIDKQHEEMDRRGVDVYLLSHRGKRYFIANRFQEVPPLRAFLFGDLMASICRATLGDRAYLFNEQFVVKAAERGMKFGWHQDSGYVGFPHKPYLSCWCALDDMTPDNGTVSMLPYARAGTREMVKHIKEEGTNDEVGYHGEDPGEPVYVPAGSIAVFSSVCFHRSGTNTTSHMRRSYLAQYASEPIVNPETGKIRGFAEPFYGV